MICIDMQAVSLVTVTGLLVWDICTKKHLTKEIKIFNELIKKNK